MATATEPVGGLLRWTPTLPTGVMNMLNPFASDESAKGPVDGETAKESKRPALATVLPAAASSESPPSPSRSVMFAEPDARTNSDDGSRRSSVSSQCGRKRRKSSVRPKTCFSLCHPPPASQTRQKLHLRPRSLLQLHKLSPGARPVPAYEVVPSANFSVRLTRAITKVFKAKHGLCPNDLVMLRAENYSTKEGSEEQEARDVIGLICKGRKEDGSSAGRSKICMADGTEWEAYSTPKGGFEFFSTDEHGLGLTVRWVLKKGRDEGKSRFNFSTISPNSRKHPVIASMSKSGIDICDSYKMPDPKAATPLSTPLQDIFVTDRMEDEEDESPDRSTILMCDTDDRLRQIIAVTGIWVAFKEGWSPFYKFDDDSKGSGIARSPSLRDSPSKAGASPFSTPPGSPSMVPDDKRGSIRSIGSGIIRRSSVLSRGNRSSSVSVCSTDEPQRSESIPARTGRSRADSASTVLVHRAASNRRKNNQQAAWRTDLLQPTHQVLSETSREDLSCTSDADADTDALDETPMKRKDSLPSPLIPAVSHTDDSSAAEDDGEDEQGPFDKRESTGTTDTKISSPSSEGPSAARKLGQPAPVEAKPKTKPKRGLRRLLCGSSKS